MSSSDDGSVSATLDGLELLMFMSPEVRSIVTRSFVRASYPFGTVIVAEGDPADAFFVIVDGRARALTTGDGGEEITLNVLGPGDSFGEIALLEGGVRTATVRASTPVDALRLDGAVFRALVASDASIRESVELSARHHAARDLLRRHSAFADLPHDAMAQLLRQLEPIDVAAGEAVIRQGDDAGALFVVRDGRLRAWRDEDGEHHDVAFLRTGDVFGERALFTGEPRHATVEALVDCRLLRLDEEAFRRLLAEHPAFAERVALQVAQYDYRRTARVPLDFADEILPADAAIPDLVELPDPEVEPQATAEEPTGPFAGDDRRFVKRAERIRRFRHVRQVDEADCGAAALAMICRHHGRFVSLAQARQAVGTGIDGTSLRGIAHGAEQLGFATRAVKSSRRNLDELPLPAVVHWRGNHWVVLYDVGDSHIRIADPASGLRRLPRGALDEHWSGYTVLFAPTERLAALASKRTRFAWLRPILRRFRRPILVASLLALLISALQLLLPVFTQIVVDRVLADRDLELLHVLLVALGGVILVSVGASLLQRYLLARAAVRLDADTLDLIAGRMLALPMRYFYARRTGDIQRRLLGMRQVRELAVQSGVGAIVALAQLLAAVGLMFVYSSLLALVFLGAVPVYVALMRLAQRRLRPLIDTLEESFARYHSLQVDAIKGVETVKALGAEERLRASMVREFAGLSERQFRADFASMAYEGAVQVVTFVSLAAFLWVGSLQVLDGRLTVGEFVSFNALVVLAGIPIGFLLALWDQLQFASVLVERLNDIFEEEPEQGADHSHLRPVPTLAGHVRLDRVDFRYGGTHSPAILEGIALDVPAGTTVAIVGRSGSGKTTLVKCLAGLLEPTGGTILYDGVDMRTLRYADLRRQVGFVLQENFLFADSIAANIAFGDEDPDLARVQWAARVANAHEFIARLPLGYDTKVGETGLLLSGGQRQRVAIARAVYNQPPILILDEATSSLDTESERAVQANIDRLLEGRTSFVIAHRLSTIRHADVIVVLEKGRLVEQGSHDELLARKGLYFYLSSEQLEL